MKIDKYLRIQEEHILKNICEWLLLNFKANHVAYTVVCIKLRSNYFFMWKKHDNLH